MQIGVRLTDTTKFRPKNTPWARTTKKRGFNISGADKPYREHNAEVEAIHAASSALDHSLCPNGCGAINESCKACGFVIVKGEAPKIDERVAFNRSAI